jgi:hypothetical protein
MLDAGEGESSASASPRGFAALGLLYERDLFAVEVLNVIRIDHFRSVMAGLPSQEDRSYAAVAKDLRRRGGRQRALFSQGLEQEPEGPSMANDENIFAG